ncbi:DUF2339 domain-containing protein [Pseudomonas baltica]|uniref:DUF2339 domain-containing protein n=1 Tax=Pseudomonas baltica TaxID=2762576 RepID=UPI002898DAFC|nr:DUF2339 domain-containing protein [Pseudomonas baltica]
MQLILMFIGLLVGLGVEASFTSALLGALTGLAAGQAIRLVKLGYETRTQRALLASMRTALEDVTTRLQRLEAHPQAASEAVQQAVVAPVVATVTPPPTQAPPSWSPTDAELPDELSDSGWYASSAPAEPAKSAKPRAPQAPGLFAKAIVSARQWLLGGNTVLRVGVVLLFIGLAFLLRYASETYSIPVEARYIAVALVALLLLILGWRLFPTRPQYGLILQGAGVAVLYLTIFAAMTLDHLLAPLLGMALMVGIVVLSGVLAVLQNAMSLACVAALGGFAAPILASSGGGSHVGLFTYFAILDCGILGIAWFKAWRPLNLIGFTGTFAIGFAWGMRSYQPALFWSTEAFLLLFFCMYLAVGLLFARQRLLEGTRQGSRFDGYYVDGSLLFGPPLAAFGLQCVLVKDFDLAIAFSALALGALYLGLAWVLRRRDGVTLRLLIDTCLAIGVIFASLAIPLAVDNTWTSAAWAVEGGGLLWLGLRQQRLSMRCFAMLLQLGATIAYLLTLDFGGRSLFDGSVLGALLLGCALLFNFYRLHRAADGQVRNGERYALPLWACMGLGFIYLISPLSFDYQGTVVGWAFSGLLTVLAALHLAQRQIPLPSTSQWELALPANASPRTLVYATGSVLLCGCLIQMFAGGLLLLFGQGLWGDVISDGSAPFARGDFWAASSLALAAMLAAWAVHRQALAGNVDWRRVRHGLLAWGALWWWLGFSSEILRTAPVWWQSALTLVVLALSVALGAVLAPRLRWPALAHVCLVLMPVAALYLAVDGVSSSGASPLVTGMLGLVVWVLVFGAHFFSLRRLQPLLRGWAEQGAHVLGCWVLIVVVALQMRGALLVLADQHNAWRWLGWALAPSLYLLAMAAQRPWPWPVSALPRTYRWLAAWPVAAVLLVWFWLANLFSDGAARPLPYVPIINPLELALLFALLALLRWSRAGQAQQRLAPRWQWLLGASAFAFATAAVMRAVHHWAGVPYDASALLESMRAQAALSILWTVIALALMVHGSRRQRRSIWLVGAALIAVVVAKLFLVELGNQGGLARIISFIGVGALLLVIGYFAPPVTRESAHKGQQN